MKHSLLWFQVAVFSLSSRVDVPLEIRANSGSTRADVSIDLSEFVRLAMKSASNFIFQIRVKLFTRPFKVENSLRGSETWLQFEVSLQEIWREEGYKSLSENQRKKLFRAREKSLQFTNARVRRRFRLAMFIGDLFAVRTRTR